MSPPQDTQRQQNLLSALLVALVFLLLVVPLFENDSVGQWLLKTGLSLVLVIAAIATHRRRAALVLGLIFVGAAAPVTWATLFVDNPLLFLISSLLDSLFFATMGIYILWAVLQKHLATIHSIYGAICGYLLIGLAFAVLYMGLGRIHVGLTIDNDPSRAFSAYVYFSFVTMSTLGYGDIVAVSKGVRTLSWMQSVIGQFYLAVVVAWLISEIPRRRS